MGKLSTWMFAATWMAAVTACDETDRFLMLTRGYWSEVLISYEITRDGVVLARGNGTESSTYNQYDDVCLPASRDGCFELNVTAYPWWNECCLWNFGPWFEGGGPETSDWWDFRGPAGTSDKFHVTDAGIVKGCPANDMATLAPTPLWTDQPTYEEVDDVVFPVTDGVGSEARLNEALPGVAVLNASFRLEDQVLVLNSSVVRGEGFEIQAPETTRAFEVGFGITLVLEHLIIRGGSTTIRGYGGLVLVEELSTLRLVGSSLFDRGARFGGGVFLWDDAVLLLENTTIARCWATQSGGGVYTIGEVSMIDSTIEQCDALDEWSSGGALDLMGWYKPFYMENSVVAECSAVSGSGISLGSYNTMTIKNSLIRDCAGPGAGGGIVIYHYSHAELYGVRIERSNAGFGGGGIYAYDGATLLVEDSIAEGCTAMGVTGFPGRGGGINLRPDCVATIKRSTLRNCHGLENGGGFYVLGSAKLALEATTIENCTVLGTHGVGAGISVESDDDGEGQVVLSDGSAVRGCSAAYGGGVSYSGKGGTLRVEASAISDCYATFDGGGASIAVLTRLVADRTTFADNVAGDRGGALYAPTQSSVLLMAGSAFEANSAFGAGGGAIACADCILAMRGGVQFVRNVATTCGGAVLIWGQAARLFTSRGDMAFVQAEAAGLERDGEFAIYNRHNPYDLWDCTGAFAGGSIVGGNPDSTQFTFCLPTNVEFILAGFELETKGWGDGTLVLRSGQEDLANDETIESITVPVSVSNYKVPLTLRSSSSGTTAPVDRVPVFRENVANRGGGMCLQDSAQAHMAGARFEMNVAMTPELREGGGGGLRAVRGVALQLWNVSFRENRALGSLGGAVYLKQCGAVEITECTAHGNVATLGGFLAIEQSTETTRFAALVATSNRAFSDGGAVAVVDCDFVSVTLESSTFADNTADGSGGAVSARKSHIAFESCTFLRNSATDGGAVAVFDNAETTANFEQAACTAFEFFIDFRETQYVCMPDGDIFDDNSLTCDWLAGSCFNNFNADGTDCRGCGCAHDFELWVAQGDDDDPIVSGFPTGNAFPIAAAVKRVEACVNSRLPVRALASDRGTNGSWWGGTFFARVKGGTTLWGPFATSDGVVNIDLPAQKTSAFYNNSALNGAGAVFWEDRTPDALDTVEASNNTASYGPFVGTPARSLQLQYGNMTIYSVPSGELPTRPLRVAVLDAYDQVATRGADNSYARIHKQSGNSTIQDGFAPFVEGIAEFRTMVVVHVPGSVFNATVDSPLESLADDHAVTTAIHVRSCISGEKLADDGRSCDKCQRGEYAWNGDCVRCTAGMICENVGSDLTKISIESGYWRAALDSAEVIECPDADSNCAGGVGTGICENNWSGRLCSVCDGDYRMRRGKCRRCKGSNDQLISAAIFSVLGISFIAFLRSMSKVPKLIVKREDDSRRDNNIDGPRRQGSIAAFRSMTQRSLRNLTLSSRNVADIDPRPPVGPVAIARVHNSTMPPSTDETSASEEKSRADNIRMLRLYSKLNHKWKLLVGSIQVQLLTAQALGQYFPLPNTFLRMTGAFSFIMADFLSYGQVSCALSVDYYRSFKIGTSAPLALILLAVIVIKIINAFKGKRIYAIHPVIIIIVFFAFPNASSKLASLFLCRHFSYEDESFLRADLSKECGGTLYIGWRFYAVGMIGVWVIGTPVLFAFLVWRHRDEIVGNTDRLLDPKLHGTKLLWLPYARKYWYWEAVEASKKILLSFAAALFRPGTPLQPAFCLFVITIFLAANIRCSPFDNSADNVLAESLMWLLFVQFFAFLFITTGQNVSAVLDIILSSTLLFSIVVAFIIVIWDLRRDAIAAKDVKDFIAVKLQELSPTARANRRASAARRTSLSPVAVSRS